MKNSEYLKAPFPYFGGKSQIADTVWHYLGDVKRYIEPFAGSCAVLLKRPPTRHSLVYEIINDIDGAIINVWRSISKKPEEVARFCLMPVSHIELYVRRKRLIEEYERLTEKLKADEEYCNPQLAGYYIWCASCWIGGDFLNRPIEENAKGCPIPHIAKNKGINSALNKNKVSENAKDCHRPHIEWNMGIICALIKNKVSEFETIDNADDFSQYLEKQLSESEVFLWMQVLYHRLKNVKSICGDWKRVCGGNWQDNAGQVGIFFDPPYAAEGRQYGIYHHDSLEVAKEVEDWCLKRGDNPNYRIVVAGYDDEYGKLVSNGWRIVEWKAHGGYANLRKKGTNNNRYRERLFISPYCNDENILMKGERQLLPIKE